MKLTFKEACEAVADLFEAVPEVYATEAYAIDSNGNYTLPDNPDACQWCAVGGVAAALEEPYPSADTMLKLNEIAALVFPNYITLHEVNDKLGREAAIRVLREAAK